MKTAKKIQLKREKDYLERERERFPKSNGDGKEEETALRRNKEEEETKATPKVTERAGSLSLSLSRLILLL